MKQKHIAILDFGSQYMHLISRRIRQLGVLSKIYPSDVNAHELKDAVGVILSGSPRSVYEEKVPYDPGVFDLPVPVLGLCYGHQLMAHVMGGEVKRAHQREYGQAALKVQGASALFEGLSVEEQVWMSHGDSVTRTPEGFEVIGVTEDGTVAAMANEATRRYGLQFHMEVHHTTNGMKMLENFVVGICGAEKNWSMEEYLKTLENELVAQVGEKKVFVLVSGGVDSAVAFALLEKLLGKERVYGLHVDTGFMRLNESGLVKEALARGGFENLHVVDASEAFLVAVAGMTDPETKRKTIGKLFLDIQRQEFAKMKLNADEWLLGQGTIYPDTIESGGTKASDKIKTHHNRVDEILEMINQGKVVEPLVALYKDEVRSLGKNLGLSEELLNRWPFPGPGLSIRALCSTGEADVVEDAAGTQKQLAEIVGSSASVAALPLKSVGVQGDERSYRHPAVIFGQSKIDWGWLNTVSVKITNSVRPINRVVLQVGGVTAPTEMKVKEGYLTRDRLDVLREADAVVEKIVRKHHLYEAIWQFPVILMPLTAGTGESIVLRPIESQEAMTVNFYHMDHVILQEMVDALLQVPGVDAVFYDITNKPPATIEWE